MMNATRQLDSRMHATDIQRPILYYWVYIIVLCVHGEYYYYYYYACREMKGSRRVKIARLFAHKHKVDTHIHTSKTVNAWNRTEHKAEFAEERT